jgi:hypothetical protein
MRHQDAQGDPANVGNAWKNPFGDGKASNLISDS